MAKWYTGKSPDSRERYAERVIYEILTEYGSEVQWSQLKETAKERGISSTTLSKHLKHGVDIGMIGRRVDESTYPPNVYYYKIFPKIPDVVPAESRKLLLEEVELVKESFGKIAKEKDAEKRAKMAYLLVQHLFASLMAGLSIWIINACERKKTFKEADAYLRLALNVDVEPRIKFLHGFSYHTKEALLPILHKVSADFFSQSGNTLLDLYILCLRTDDEKKD